MKISTKKEKSHPLLPAALSLPLKILPAFVHNKVLVSTLNRMFSNELKQGELDFMQGKIIHISIEDAGFEYRFTLDKNRLAAADKNQDRKSVV